MGATSLEGDTATLIKTLEVPGVFYKQDCGLIAMAFDPNFETNHLFTGWVRAAVLDANGAMTHDVEIAERGGITSWAQRPDGYLYLTTLGPYDSATSRVVSRSSKAVKPQCGLGYFSRVASAAISSAGC